MYHNDKNNPFRYYDPRSLGSYKNLKVPNGIVIPTTDEGAWEYFKEFRHVYNKLDLALSQNIKCAPMGVVPEKFPVFVKPIYNLLGMGIGTRKISSLQEYDYDETLSGSFWMEYLQGEHLSHDFVFNKGEIVFFISFKGHPLGKGMFDYWETIEMPANNFDFIKKWVGKNLNGYTGCFNAETIGGKIIECHLRFGEDIPRLGNLNLMKNIVNVYARKSWNFNEKIPKFYLFVLWGDKNISYKINKTNAKDICKKLTFYEIFDLYTYNSHPPGGVRIAVLGSYNKQDCIKARHLLYDNFEPKPRKPKVDY